MQLRPTIPLLLAGLLVTAPAVGDVYIYPAKGQSKDQQEKDKYECNQWAVQQTGFNPMDPPTATAPPPRQQAPVGGVMRGGMRGAAIGAVGGAIGGNAGKGAAIGAAAGGMMGGMRRRDQVRNEQYQQQQWADQQSSQYNARRGNWQKAYSTCLSGRGYTVS